MAARWAMPVSCKALTAAARFSTAEAVSLPIDELEMNIVMKIAQKQLNGSQSYYSWKDPLFIELIGVTNETS